MIGKVDFVGPLAGRKRISLSFPDEQFQALSYTTAKGKGGYSAIDTTYAFEHNSGHYKCRAVVVKSDDLCEQEKRTLDKNLGKVDADLQKFSNEKPINASTGTLNT